MEDGRCPVCGARPILELLAVANITSEEWAARHTCDPINLVNTKYYVKDIVVHKIGDERYDVLINGEIERPNCNADDAMRALNICIWEAERHRLRKLKEEIFDYEANRERERKRSKWYVIIPIVAFAFGAGWFDPVIRALDTTPAEDIQWLTSIFKALI
jgi:hypothetical protein